MGQIISSEIVTRIAVLETAITEMIPTVSFSGNQFSSMSGYFTLRGYFEWLTNNAMTEPLEDMDIFSSRIVSSKTHKFIVLDKNHKTMRLDKDRLASTMPSVTIFVQPKMWFLLQ
jgi:hypothetical protein